MTTHMTNRWAITADDVEYTLDPLDETVRLVWHHTGTDQILDVDLSADDALQLAARLTAYARAEAEGSEGL